MIGLGALSVVALGASSVGMMVQRAANQSMSHSTYSALIQRLSMTLKTPVAIRKSAAIQPTNVGTGVLNGNAMLNACMYGPDDDTNVCASLPPPTPPYNYTPAMMSTKNSPPPDQEDARRFVLTDVLGNTNPPVHSNTTEYWALNGVPCDGLNGDPVYNPSQPQFCPFQTSVRFTAICNTASTDTNPADYGQSCGGLAEAFFFYYTVAWTQGVQVAGVTPPASFDSTQSDPIIYTAAELINSSWAQVGQCDYKDGYAISGVNSDGSLACAKINGQRTALAIHSFTNQQPSCAFNVVDNSGNTTSVTFNSLLPASGSGQFASFGGAWIDQRVGAPADLGKPQSCQQINSNMLNIASGNFAAPWIMDCGGPNQWSSCANSTSNNYSMWMRALNVSPPSNSSPLDITHAYPYMSRCNVCEIDGPVIAVHDFQSSHPDSPPACPQGWSRLYTGRSVGAFSLEGTGNSSGYNSPQDLASPGSCIPLPNNGQINAVPFLDCKHYADGHGTATCGYGLTGSESTLWFARSGSEAYQCSVCYRPPALELPPQPTATPSPIKGVSSGIRSGLGSGNGSGVLNPL